ncbi:hypothetical protein IQ07DRAFT_84554 [Pyrenochaeta sp. DS3sAY3a]|nr:hypothetical protein IQ07DRAFT_84554 [Pyrenochaeta sp. DS3sAY3a]
MLLRSATLGRQPDGTPTVPGERQEIRHGFGTLQSLDIAYEGHGGPPAVGRRICAAGVRRAPLAGQSLQECRSVLLALASPHLTNGPRIAMDPASRGHPNLRAPKSNPPTFAPSRSSCGISSLRGIARLYRNGVTCRDAFAAKAASLSSQVAHIVTRPCATALQSFQRPLLLSAHSLPAQSSPLRRRIWPGYTRQASTVRASRPCRQPTEQSRHLPVFLAIPSYYVIPPACDDCRASKAVVHVWSHKIPAVTPTWPESRRLLAGRASGSFRDPTLPRTKISESGLFDFFKNFSTKVINHAMRYEL